MVCISTAQNVIETIGLIVFMLALFAAVVRIYILRKRIERLQQSPLIQPMERESGIEAGDRPKIEKEEQQNA